MAQGLKNYSVLKGSAIDIREGSGSSPHFQLLIVDDLNRHRIAVNVQSQDGSMVQYLVRSQFRHPICDKLQCPRDRAPLLENRGLDGLALDYIRG